MTDRFEIMKLWIPLGDGGYQAGGWAYTIPVNNANTEKEWQKAVQFANDGWELVNAIPIAGQKGSGEVAQNFTVGYILFFKRLIQ